MDGNKAVAATSPFIVSGSCLCGAVQYSAEAPPRSVHYCHCSMCRRTTGSAFAVLAWWERDQLKWSGELRVYRSSPIAERGFCPHCGSPMVLAYDGQSEIAVHAGTLSNPNVFPPTYHYGSEARLAWADCAMALPAKETRERF